ncbi:hypothetical protein HFV06_01340 [Pseudomonas fluorescens]|jgi:hypothetical protein|uniref:hypothetical protein n=2 Tax=Pseudomonas TaxID=286 RepID=UPI00084B9876|nr:hypothetical protein [Pseudomonas sp. AP19]NKI45799.1 hypothetical protein [Pseudomonas fluorescens]NKI55678.1 hypothetical protein [Pseudomonas fluorescens]NKI62477.1 hypothetical protein [Pseudomonas fluorescens]OEC72958.1 hypothetical protein A7D21_27670 [Pseudomonas sp. AP19]
MRLEWLCSGRANLQCSAGVMLLFIVGLKRLILLHPALPDLSTGQQDRKLDDVSKIEGCAPVELGHLDAERWMSSHQKSIRA